MGWRRWLPLVTFLRGLGLAWTAGTAALTLLSDLGLLPLALTRTAIHIALVQVVGDKEGEPVVAVGPHVTWVVRHSQKSPGDRTLIAVLGNDHWHVRPPPKSSQWRKHHTRRSRCTRAPGSRSTGSWTG